MGGLAFFYWATLPPHTIAFDQACRIHGAQAEVSAWLHGKSYWRKQIKAAQKSLEWYAAQPAAEARLREQEEVESSQSGIESRMTHLSQSVQPPDTPDGEAIRQHDRLEKIGWLSRCITEMQGRLENGAPP